jgi:SAM-dependent methyltransferase
MVRIAITEGAAGNSYDIQLNQSRLKVAAGHRYILTFLARADQPRNVSFGLAIAHAPWSNLGLYGQAALTPEWQCFEETFVATEDEEQARIHFDLGASGISTELSAVALRSLSEGCYVEPPPTAPQKGYGLPSRVLDEAHVPFGQVKFGSFFRVTPISRNWGTDRGCPVDRYYIERFLSSHGCDIQGRVLEIDDDSYTRKFGGERVAVQDVLHVSEGNPRATLVADLACAPHIPSDTFDCIILTQTLQHIYDVRSVIHTLHRILKPSGVVLATVPGISQTIDIDGPSGWWWNFTPASAKRMFAEAFASADVKVEAFGNVLSAISFLHGLAAEELTPQELDYSEPGYEVTVAVRARKEDAGS